MPSNEQLADFEFPLGGINLLTEFQEQPPGTTPISINCRGINPDSLRARGGSRAGLSKYITDVIPADATQTLQIQHLAVIVDPQAEALGQKFFVPDDTWVEDPLNPGTWIPPGGWGYQGGTSLPKRSGSGPLAVVVSLEGEGEMGDGGGPTCTEWSVEITMKPSFGDIFGGAGNTEITYCDCADPESIDTNVTGADLASPSDLESADTFAAFLQDNGYAATTADIDTYDRTELGSC